MTNNQSKSTNKFTDFQSKFDELWSAVAFPVFAGLISRFLLLGLSMLHWSLAMVAAAAFFALIIWLLIALARWPPTRHPVQVTLSLYAGVVSVGASVCAFLSHFIYTRNPGAYSSNTELSNGRFYDFYVWYFIDMLPLKVWETLMIEAPIKVGGRLGAAPLLLFRIVVALPVITLVAKWYKARFLSNQPNTRNELG